MTYHMKNTPEDHAVVDRLQNVAAAPLRAFVERIEHLAAEKSEVAEQMKDVYAELKGAGYDAKAVRKIVAMRKRDKDDLAEEAAIMELYLVALGMA